MLRSLDLPVAPALALSTRAADGTVALRVTGELVAGRSEALSAWSLRRLPACTRLLVVDLAAVTALDAVGVGTLVALRRRVAGEVVLAGVPRALRPVLARAGALAVLADSPVEDPLAA